MCLHSCTRRLITVGFKFLAAVNIEKAKKIEASCLRDVDLSLPRKDQLRRQH